MKEKEFSVTYNGSKFWLIFWILIYFPVAVVLFFSKSIFYKGDTRYHINYRGDRFWLCLWTLLFFPVALLLLVLNGIVLVSSEE